MLNDKYPEDNTADSATPYMNTTACLQRQLDALFWLIEYNITQSNRFNVFSGVEPNEEKHCLHNRLLHMARTLRDDVKSRMPED
jgi:hypothetical protein